MPLTAEWSMPLTHLKILTLTPAEPYTWPSGPAEWIVLPLSGSCQVECTAVAAPEPDRAAPAAAPYPAPPAGEALGAPPAVAGGAPSA
ncbi:hypothetical protein EF918_02315, partial [Streptomyces sp. WAC06614]